MPFLHWFRKTSQKTKSEGKPSSVEKSNPEQPPVTLASSENSGPETVPEAPLIERHSSSPPEQLPDQVADPRERPAAQLPEDATPGTESAGLEIGGSGGSAEREIRLRLEPILSNFPPDLQQPPIRAESDNGTEIVLPLDLIQSQLADGRVVVSAAMFCSVLPTDLKPYFADLDPTAEIPIPLREIFLRLPPELIKLREDQEIDYPAATILTLFSQQAEEDANRLGQGAPPPPEPGPAPAPLMSKISFDADSEKLNAIFMTDEALDLPKAIALVAELPGLRACLLSTVDGLKLAGKLDDPSQEQAISTFLPGLFQQARSKLAGINPGILETITLSFSRNQISTFIQGNLCLTVLHDNRPFKPGVREKVRAVISELATLKDKEPKLSPNADDQLRQ